MTIYNNPTIKVKLRNSTTLSVPLPPFVNINAVSISVVNSISIGNSTVNTQINATAISLKSLRANGSFGTFGQVLTSNGTGLYWSTVTGGGGGGSFSNGIPYIWSEVQTFASNVIVDNATLSVGNTTSNVTANTTHIVVGNSTVNVSVNSTAFSGTANNANNLEGSSLATIQGQITGNAATAYTNAVADAASGAAGIYQTTAGLSANVVTLTANNSNRLGTELPSFYTNATNITTGTLPVAQLPANIVFWSNTNTFTAVQTLNQNLIVNSATLSVGNTTANITANTTELRVGNSTVNVSVNSTVFSGTANNATNLGGVAAASYINTTGAYTITGVHTMNANLIANSATLSVGNTTANVTTNTTHIVVGNSTVNVSVNSTVFSGTSNNATNLGGVAAASYINTSGAYTITGVHTLNANLIVNSAVLHVGNTIANVTVNTTHIVVGNSTVNVSVNSTAFSGIANNANNLGGQLPAFYTNATNITTGTLPWSQAPSGTVNTSGAFTFTAVQTFNQNLIVNSATLSVGNTTANITANTTHIVVGNTTVNVSINSTAFSGISNNANNLGGQLPSFYRDATNINAGTLDFARLPANAVFWSNTNTFTAVQTLNQNLVVNSATLSVGNTTANITANTTELKVGNSTVNVSVNSTAFSGIANNANNLGGQLPAFYTNATNLATGTVPTARLATSGTPSSTTFLRGDQTWATPAGGGGGSPGGSTGDIQFNDAGAFLGSANLKFDNATTLLSVGTASTNTQINSSSIAIRTLIANAQVGTSGQVLTSSGSGANVYWQTLSAFSTSTPYTFTAVQTFNQNLIVNSATLSVGNTTANITANTTVLTVGNSTVNVSINSTAFSGIANNANNLGGQLPAFYTNATNITTGTLPVAQLPANVVFWSNTNTFTAVQTLNQNLIVNSATLSVGNTTANITANTTVLTIGNTTVNTQVNSSSITLRNLIANGSTGTSGQVLTSSGAGANLYWANPSGGGLLAGNGLISNTTHYEILANTGIVANSTGAFVNASYIATLTANDSTNLGAQPASFYTNATNITTGTLNSNRLPANVVFWSNTNTFTAVQTLNQNLIVNSATLSVGNTISNVTVNTTVITVGNTTVNTQVNSTALVLRSLIANGSIGGIGELLASNGTGLYWTAPPSGSFSNGTAYTWSAPQTFQANIVLQDRLSANGSFGSAGQVLTSSGSGANVYWSTPSGGGGGGEVVSAVSINTSMASPTTFYLASGTITLTLPTAVGNSGLKFQVKNAGTGQITINTTSSQTINENINMILTEKNSVIGLISDGSNWNIF
jgi:hypothetical protein